MIALDIMLVALAQSSVATPAQTTPPVPRPEVEVVGSRPPRRICRNVESSNSRISSGRVCETVAQIEERIDRAQEEGASLVSSTSRRTNEEQMRSGYGNWIRSRTPSPIGATDQRQTTRGQ
jgi:hypothetical protein